MKYIMIVLASVLLCSCDIFPLPISSVSFVNYYSESMLMATEMTVENYRNMNEKTVIDLEKTPFYFNGEILTFGSKYYHISVKDFNPDAKSKRKGVIGFRDIQNKTAGYNIWVNCYGELRESMWKFMIGDSLKIQAKMGKPSSIPNFAHGNYKLRSVNGWNYENDKQSTEIAETFNENDFSMQVGYSEQQPWNTRISGMQIIKTTEKVLNYFPFDISTEKEILINSFNLPIVLIGEDWYYKQADGFLLYIISNSDTQLTLRRVEENRVYDLVFDKID